MAASSSVVTSGYGIKLASWEAWGVPDISPAVIYSFQVQAMSADGLPFVLHVVFTIDPRAVGHAKVIHPAIDELVKGVLEDETRVVAASMSMEHIFHGARAEWFKKAVFESLRLKLDQFGLIIYANANANMKQPGDGYLSYLGLELEALVQAKVDVAEAPAHGEVGATSGSFDNKNKNTRRHRHRALVDRRSDEEASQKLTSATVGGKLLEAAIESTAQVSEVHDNSDLEAGLGSIAQMVTPGAGKEQLVRALFMVSHASLFFGVSAGVRRPATMGSIVAHHQAAYNGLVAAILAAVPVEMATAFYLRRSNNRRFHVFAQGVRGAGVLLLITVAAVGGFALTKA